MESGSGSLVLRILMTSSASSDVEGACPSRSAVTQGAIFEMSCRCSGTQPVRYAQYYESPFKFMLEYAVAVSETAFSIGEPARCAVYSIKAFHRMDQIEASTPYAPTF